MRSMDLSSLNRFNRTKLLPRDGATIDPTVPVEKGSNVGIVPVTATVVSNPPANGGNPVPGKGPRENIGDRKGDVEPSPPGSHVEIIYPPMVNAPTENYRKGDVASRFELGNEIPPGAVPSHDNKTQYEPLNRVSKAERIKNLVKLLIYLVLLITVILACFAGLYRLARWAIEDPTIITKEITVEKKVEVTPPECTQIRRDGKIFMNCDGVKIDGAASIEESGVENVPELL
ncbi:hypothetical protein L1D24_05360 [Vibrio brasiliensis]|uniref:hypothetical protein n=1 Tax=Vibrio brasiliensis TaxID=170652 RepID=UPI001EFEBF05|nr:hypothetical protein [Vibrio brasiliensis]MCG9647996.1 hypothetical protein [Vibrio brasiliensis]